MTADLRPPVALDPIQLSVRLVFQNRGTVDVTSVKPATARLELASDDALVQLVQLDRAPGFNGSVPRGATMEVVYPKLSGSQILDPKSLCSPSSATLRLRIPIRSSTDTVEALSAPTKLACK